MDPDKIAEFLLGLKPGEVIYLPLALAAPVAVWFMARFLIGAVRYMLADKEVRPMMRKAWRIKARWKRDARRVGLMQIERGRPKWWSSTPATTVIEREMIPPVRVRAQWWGVVVDASTLGRLGLQQFQEAALHLADIWKVPQVRVEQLRPGLVRLRAIVRDPLTEPPQGTPEVMRSPSPAMVSAPHLRQPKPASRGGKGILSLWQLPADPGVWHAGVDADGEPVTIRSSGVSGVVVAGLAGYGKTSLINARLVQLAVLPEVQLVLIDGKGGPDYDDLFARAWLSAKDDPQQVRDHLATVHRLMVDRQHAIREVLGCKNMWDKGPSPEWPLVIVIIDEAHTFFNESKGNDAESKRLDALARETTRLVEELIRKGRNVGIQTIVATQKATADAIPTKIRDNCQIAISFAQRTSEAATAILGSDITQSPDEHPRRLQDPAYIGVASMVAQNRPGFTLVRTTHVPDEYADLIATENTHLVKDPARLLTAQLAAITRDQKRTTRESGGPFRQEHPAAFPSFSPHLDEEDLL
jgi:S-DNA-T family DNA segregation ATPase FtsK/SpoIIIE